MLRQLFFFFLFAVFFNLGKVMCIHPLNGAILAPHMNYNELTLTYWKNTQPT